MCFQIKVIAVLAVATAVSPTCFKNPYVGTWVPASQSSEIPTGAVIAGKQSDHRPSFDLLICRVGGITGRFGALDKICYIYIGRTQSSYKQFEILTNVGEAVWVPVLEKQMPCNLIQSGGSSFPSFIGRINVSPNILKPGSIERGSMFYRNQYYDVFEAFVSVPANMSLPALSSSVTYATDGKYLTFRVRSDDTVFVDFGFGKSFFLRLSIGTFGNRLSSIGTTDEPLKVFEKTDKILDPERFRGFWVRWITNNIEFGVEGRTTPLVNLTDHRVYNINTATFKSNSKESSWKIPHLNVVLK